MVLLTLYTLVLPQPESESMLTSKRKTPKRLMRDRWEEKPAIFDWIMKEFPINQRGKSQGTLSANSLQSGSRTIGLLP
jgi:hypothetical protein